MPINFPDSPTLNQTYTVGSRTWKWNGSAWLYEPRPNVAVSTTQPSTPAAGDVWLNSSTSDLNVYNNSQWVNLKGATGVTGATGVAGAVGATGATGPVNGGAVTRALAMVLIFGAY